MTSQRRTSISDTRAAAVVYRADVHDREALADFARELIAGGCRVAGIVQEPCFDAQGRRVRIDSVDLASGERVTINPPDRDSFANAGCSLDPAALIDSGAPLRRALGEKPALVIVEKFGEQEQSGNGLASDILAIIAEGIPILVLVPEAGMEGWRELTGGMTTELQCDRSALHYWWTARCQDGQA